MLLMIVLLLSCSSSWCRQSRDSIVISPSTGWLTSEASVSKDSTVTIPITYIREANIKLIERKQLIELLQVKENTIKNYQTFKIKNDSILYEYDKRFSEQELLNNELKQKLRTNKRTNVFRYITGGLLGAVISLIILK